MDLRLVTSAEALAGAAGDELVEAWLVLTRAIADRALVSPDSLVGDVAEGPTFDEQIETLEHTRRSLERAAEVASLVTRSADPVMRDVDVPGMGVVIGEALARLAASIGTTFAVRLTRDLANGRVVTTGTLSQTYRPHATMAALAADRDEVCRFPYCTRPATSADLDHVIPFAEGGATSGSNLQSLCRHHHRAKTFGGYAVSMDAEATCEWESPTGRSWVTRPGGATVPLEPRAGRVA